MIPPALVHYGWWPFGKWFECPRCYRSFTDVNWYRFHYRNIHRKPS